MTTIGQRISMCRKALGLTEGDIAIACGWDDPSTLNHYVNNRRKPPLKSILSISTILKCNPGWLAFGEGTPPPYLHTEIIQPGCFPFIPWVEFVTITKNQSKFKVDSTSNFLSLNNLNLNSFILPARYEGQISIDGHKIIFSPGDLLIIDPEIKQLEHENCYIIMENDWKEPVLAQYITLGNKEYFKTIFDNEKLANSIDIQIIGTIVARLNFMI